MNKFHRIRSLAGLVIKDGMRRHAILGLILFALSLELSGIFFFKFIPRDVGRAISDFTISIGYLIGIMFLFFHAVQTVAWDDEKRSIQSILARPLSRTEYVLGIYLGLSLLLLFLNLVLASFGYGVILFIKSMVTDDYFKYISVTNYALSWLGIICIESMILSVIIFCSSIMRGGFPVLLLTVCYYFTCNGLPVVREASSQQENLTTTKAATLKWLSMIFPDFSRFDYKIQTTVVGYIPDMASLLINFTYAAFYIALFLYFASLIYQKRDLQ